MIPRFVLNTFICEIGIINLNFVIYLTYKGERLMYGTVCIVYFTKIQSISQDLAFLSYLGIVKGINNEWTKETSYSKAYIE